MRGVEDRQTDCLRGVDADAIFVGKVCAFLWFVVELGRRRWIEEEEEKMENSSGLQSRRPNNDHLGVNKIGKSIRKSPLHQPTFPNPPALAGAGAGARPTQPQVYNISKTDFRSIVQQLTGSPAPPPAAPPPVTVPAPAPPPAANSPKAASLRLQRIRPPPLSPIARAPIPLLPNPNHPPPVVAGGGGGGMWTNAGESPISVYMRYLQNSIAGTGQGRPAAVPSSGLLPTPPPATEAAQFGVPSPSGFLNLLSPRSPYPLLSPGFQFPPPLTPNFAFSAQSPGILGPAPFAPPSPGLLFPPSPSGLFPILSPRWRE